MKKTLIALAVLTVSGAAFAQSTATISGSMQVGVMDTGAAGSTAVVSHLGNGANAINIVTREDLGGGMRAGFDSQIRFNATNGDRNSSGQGNALFHGANVYVGGGFGTIRAGKIIEASNCGFDPWGCGGGAAMAAGVGISALMGAGAQASSLSYATPTINGFSAGIQSTMSTRTNERQLVNLSYAQGPWAAMFIQAKNSANTAVDPAASITDVASTGTSIAASYNFGFAKLNVVNAKTENAAGTTTADITSLSASVPMGAYTILAGYNKDSKALANADTKLAVGVNYALSKRTTLGADLFKAEGLAAVAPATGTAGTGFVIRARHTF